MAKLIKLENLRKQNGYSHQSLADAVQDYLRTTLLSKGKDITEADLKRVSYKRSTYTMLENGYVKAVPPHIIEALAHVLNTDIETIQDACIDEVKYRDRKNIIDEINMVLEFMSEEQLTALLNMLSLFKRQ